jgi:hypothetical protein
VSLPIHKMMHLLLSWFPSLGGFTFIIHILPLFDSLSSQECTIPCLLPGLTSMVPADTID